MKSLILLAMLIVSTSAFNLDAHNMMLDHIATKPTKEQFKLWHYLFQKPYDLNSELALQKYKVFKANLKFINETNAKNLGYTLGLGPFTDLTFEEFKEENLSSTMADLAAQDNNSQNSEFNSFNSKEINFDLMTQDEDDHDDVRNGRFLQNNEESKDWSYLWDYVKNQSYPRRCGSCWAFATLGVIEGFIKKDFNTKIRLSEQQLVDCDLNNTHCKGGWYGPAFSYIIRNGMMTEYDYPYRARQYKCNFNPSKVAVKLRSVNSCTNNGSWRSCSNKQVSDAIAIGPYATAIQVGNGLAHYRQGVWLPEFCEKIDHAVVVTKITGDYIKIRNSWSRYWGQAGYGLISRSTRGTSRMRACGAEEHVYQPVGLEIVNQAN